MVQKSNTLCVASNDMAMAPLRVPRTGAPERSTHAHRIRGLRIATRSTITSHTHEGGFKPSAVGWPTGSSRDRGFAVGGGGRAIRQLEERAARQPAERSGAQVARSCGRSHGRTGGNRANGRSGRQTAKRQEGAGRATRLDIGAPVRRWGDRSGDRAGGLSANRKIGLALDWGVGRQDVRCRGRS